jgi:hypothetical protein
MKTEIRNTPARSRVPKVGETFTTSLCGPNVYMRVANTEVGKSNTDHVYAVAFHDGHIAMFEKDHPHDNFLLLTIEEPVQFTIVA